MNKISVLAGNYEPEAKWYLGYANSPALHLEGPLPDFNAFVYENVQPNDKGGGFLLSTNVFPWVKFVYIDDPSYDAIRGGALGGEYKMTDGTILKSRSGWSSRAGVVNRDFADIVGDEIIETTIGYMAGFALHQNSVHLLLSEYHNPFYLVREVKFNNEPYWVPSISQESVVKPKNGT